MTDAADSALVTIRGAQAADAIGMARTYVESWRDTYPGLIPEKYLLAMSASREARSLRQRLTTPRRSAISLVADAGHRRIVGLADAGPCREPVKGFDGEVFTLYVHPDHVGRGIGRALLGELGGEFLRRGVDSMLVWVLAENPARWFYHAQGGRSVARRVIPFAGARLPAVAYGWPNTAALVDSPGQIDGQ